MNNYEHRVQINFFFKMLLIHLAFSFVNIRKMDLKEILTKIDYPFH